MTGAEGPVTALADDAAWDLLSSVTLGRLVTSFGGKLEIFPVNFVTQKSLKHKSADHDRSLLFRTAEGTKLFTTVMSDSVLFEADDHTAAEGWSVIVRGTAKVLTTAEEIHEADRAQLMPWVATTKLRYVRITPEEISARRFQFGPEPADGSIPS